MSVEDAISVAEHVVQALRQLADEVEEGDLPNQAALLVRLADALDTALRDLVAAPADLTPPEGLYLHEIRQGLEHPRAIPTLETIRWLIDLLLEARPVVRTLLQSAEITGDVEMVARAQRWLDEATYGPGIALDVDD